jgi:predicted nucleic acid-binding protein
MAHLILPDSNVFISALRAGTDPFQQFDPEAEDREFGTCGMVIMEVCRGVREPHLLRRLKERFSVMIYIPTSNQIWERAAHLAWSLDRQGRVLPAPDLIIAACALHAGAAVLTADAHFREIPGLTVLDSLN